MSYPFPSKKASADGAKPSAVPPSVDFSRSTLFSQEGKVVLVTGGGTGLGKTMATAFVQNGAKVYIASRKMKNLQATADELNALRPGSCVPLEGDLTTADGCKALAAEVSKRETKLHVLVNNSGVSWGSKLEDVDEKKGWDRVMNVNVKSIFYLTVALLPLLEKYASVRHPASVINISSICSYLAIGHQPTTANKGDGAWSYLASKAAASHLTRTLSTALMGRHVTVNAMAPGFFPTNMTSTSSPANISLSHPAGAAGRAEDIASTVLFLASNPHLSGVGIPIDGGMSLHRLDSLPKDVEEWYYPTLEQKKVEKAKL